MITGPLKHSPLFPPPLAKAKKCLLWLCGLCSSSKSNSNNVSNDNRDTYYLSGEPLHHDALDGTGDSDSVAGAINSQKPVSRH